MAAKKPGREVFLKIFKSTAISSRVCITVFPRVLIIYYYVTSHPKTQRFETTTIIDFAQESAVFMSLARTAPLHFTISGLPSGMMSPMAGGWTAAGWPALVC